MTDPQIFRSRMGQVLAVLAGAVALIALVTFVTEEGPTALLTTLAPVALVGALAWAVFWNPRVLVDEDAITIVNVLRTVSVPWRRFKQADSKWALTITTTAGATYTAWAVPAGSGFGARLVPNRQQQGDWAPAQRKLASTGTAEAATMAIGERVRERQKPGDSDAAVTVTPNTLPIAVVGALAVLTALSIALG